MDFKELEKLVITGHDLGFEYDNNKYEIVKGPEGFNFSDVNKKETLQNYSNALELLIKVDFNGKKLKDISNEITNIHVY